MGGGRTDSKCSSNTHARVKNMEYEDSDEDYVAEVDEVNDQSEELDSLVGDASEEESLFEVVVERKGEEEQEEEEVEEENWEKDAEEEDDADDDDDDDDYDDDHDEWRTVIAVPERDQVYQPSEEELRDFLNPYENVMCTECHQGGDDALMLLCDLCDSPAHTYCVGLGHEVPEGNWYCDGCRPAALGPSHPQTQDPALDLRTSTGMSDGPSYENMAEIDLNVSIPETPVSQENGVFPSPRVSSGNFQAPSPASGMGVSTVSGRRMIHILSNRLSQISPAADISYLGNLAGHGINATQQLNRLTDIGYIYQAHYVDRLLENPSHSVQNRDSFPGRLGNMMRGLGQPSTSAIGFAHSQEQWSESDRLNLGDGHRQVTVSEQLRSCTSRSNVGPEIVLSPSDQRCGEQANFLKQQVHIMVRSQLKSLSRDMNLGKFISFS